MLNLKFKTMKTKTDLYEFIIPDWARCYLVNSDCSGMEYEDIEKVNKFCKNLIKEYGNANLMPGDIEDKDCLGFCHSNDIDNLGANCYRMYLSV